MREPDREELSSFPSPIIQDALGMVAAIVDVRDVIHPGQKYPDLLYFPTVPYSRWEEEYFFFTFHLLLLSPHHHVVKYKEHLNPLRGGAGGETNVLHQTI